VADSGAFKKPRLVVALYAPVTRRDNSRHSRRFLNTKLNKETAGALYGCRSCV